LVVVVVVEEVVVPTETKWVSIEAIGAPPLSTTPRVLRPNRME
jgi:hypothetical protein